jgi:hypothetical protein
MRQHLQTAHFLPDEDLSPIAGTALRACNSSLDVGTHSCLDSL